MLESLEKKINFIIEDNFKSHFKFNYLASASLNSITEGFSKILEIYNNQKLKQTLLEVRPSDKITFVDKMYAKVISEFENYFTRIADFVKKELNVNNRNDVLQIVCVTTLETLKTSIPQIKEKVSFHFCSVKDNLESYIEKIKNEVDCFNLDIEELED